MKCPICGQRDSVELNLHAEGFTTNTRECGHCGALWTFSGDRRIMLREKNDKPINWNRNACPSCHHHDISDMHLKHEQFSEDILSCSICGTVWSINHGATEVVADSITPSFLSARTECVEADDYFCLA